MESENRFTEEDEKNLQKAIQFLKHREMCQEPFDGYWDEEDEE